MYMHIHIYIYNDNNKSGKEIPEAATTHITAELVVKWVSQEWGWVS